jgi:protein phosphatase
MPLALNIGACTLCGQRPENEDAIAVKRFSDLTVCLVADGMGGTGLGAEAGRRAVEIVTREIKCRIPPTATQDQAREAIRAAVACADADIRAEGALGGAARRMGSTLVGAFWRKGEMYLTNLGDSRAYVIRRGKIERLSADHVVGTCVLLRGPQTRKVLYRYLGAGENESGPEVPLVMTQTRDRFLLCTDGLHDVVSDDHLLESIQSQGVQQCADALAQLALDSGSQDNVSCIVIEVVDVASQKDNLTSDRGAVVLPANRSPAIRALAVALRGGDDCAFALHDALLEAGHDELAEHFQDRDHPEWCWALQVLLRRPALGRL